MMLYKVSLFFSCLVLHVNISVACVYIVSNIPKIDIYTYYSSTPSKIDGKLDLKSDDYCNMKGAVRFRENADLTIEFISKRDGALFLGEISSSMRYRRHQELPAIGQSYDEVLFFKDNILVYRESPFLFLRWDSVLDSWIDVSTETSMPSGDYSSFISLDESVIFSVEEGADRGVWDFNGTFTKLSSSPLGESAVRFSDGGRVQLKGDEINGYEVEYLDTNLPAIDVPIESAINVYTSNVNEFGTLFEFQIGGSTKLFWKGINDSAVSALVLPFDDAQFKGCFNSRDKIYCGLERQESFYLYRLLDGLFRIDAIINEPELIGSNNRIDKVLSVGESRFFSVFDGNRYRLLEYKQSVLSERESTEISSLNDKSGIYDSHDPSIFYWYDFHAGQYNLTYYKLSGSLEYEPLLVLDPNDVIDPDETVSGGGEFEEREESGEDEFVRPPRAELSGALSMYYILAVSLLLVTVPRRRLK